jgi:cell division protein FtsI/penicillin-binding protein 2
LDIVSALASSCNSYFLEMASQLRGADMHDVVLQFGLDSPGDSLTGPALMGLGEDWTISPLHMAKAYLELNRRRADPGIAEILSGLARSAQSGTGSGVGRVSRHSGALVKTGTAVCRHAHRAPGDGFVIALVPDDQPQFLLMVRVHGIPGAVASVIAGRMLTRLEQ